MNVSSMGILFAVPTSGIRVGHLQESKLSTHIHPVFNPWFLWLSLLRILIFKSWTLLCGKTEHIKFSLAFRGKCKAVWLLFISFCTLSIKKDICQIEKHWKTRFRNWLTPQCELSIGHRLQPSTILCLQDLWDSEKFQCIFPVFPPL